MSENEKVLKQKIMKNEIDTSGVILPVTPFHWKLFTDHHQKIIFQSNNIIEHRIFWIIGFMILHKMSQDLTKNFSENRI